MSRRSLGGGLGSWKRRGHGKPSLGRGYSGTTVATAIAALASQSCGLVERNSSAPTEAPAAGSSNQTGGSGGGAGMGAGGLGAAGSATGGSGVLLVPPVDPPECSLDAKPLFQDQAVATPGPQRVFYSWTTEEQAAELRAGGDLFSRSERPGMGRGLLFDDLASFAARDPDPTAIDSEPARQLADLLGTQVFAKQRYAWPNPWATLLGLADESYGTQLLKIELAPEAWIVSFDARSFQVVDVDGQPVPINEALKAPNRIGAIFYRASGDPNAGRCGTFSRGPFAFREFALGNIQMVSRWSLATDEITQRLQDDVKELRALSEWLETCRQADGPRGEFASSLACEWGTQSLADWTLGAYHQSLGLPNDLYYPSPENLEALVATIEANLPSGEPLVVAPRK